MSDGSEGSDTSTNPYSGGGNYGGYTTGSNTNATDTNQVNTSQNNYTSSTPSDGSWGSGYNSFTPSVYGNGGLAAMFNGNYGGYTTGSQYNITNPAQIANAQQAQENPDSPSLMQRLGIVPGMSKESYFNGETPSQQADRMGLVGGAVGGVGQGLMSAFTPLPMSLGLGAARAYSSYQNNPDQSISGLVGKVAQGLPGLFGAGAQALQGNYGAAIANTLGKYGASPYTSMAGQIGGDLASGKNINGDLGSLAGYTVGNQAGGPVGGVLGLNLGKSLAGLFK